MGLIINSQEVTKIELGGVEVMKIEDGQGRILYESGPKYLCFESLADGSYVGGNGRSGVTLECSTDKVNWNPWDWEAYTYLNAGDKLYVRGTNSYISTSNSLFRFKMSGSIAASGDLTTILDPDGNVTTVTAYCFYSIFKGCSALTTAPDMTSVTSIGDYGCWTMYNDCTSLAKAPDMSNVATAGQWGMAGMFEGCTSLATAPDLRNLTSVGSYGCAAMYARCSLMSTVYAPSITTWNTTNFQGWVTTVAIRGTMWKPVSLTIPNGNDGIPSGWTTQNYPERSVTITFDTTNGHQIQYSTSDGRDGIFVDNIGTLEISESQTIDIITADVYEELKKNSSFQGCGTDYTYAYADLANGDVFTSVGVTPDCSCWQEQGYADNEECNCIEFGEGCPGPDECQECIDNCGGDPDCEAACYECDNPCGGPCLDCTDCSNWGECGYADYEDCQCQQYGECGEEEPEEEPEE